DGGVFHGAGFFEALDDLGNRGFFLTNRDVDAFYAGVFLIDDRVDSDSGFTGLAVTNDQLALSTSDGNHGVDGFQAGLHRLENGLTCDDAGGFDFDLVTLGGFDRPAAVDRLAECVDNASFQAGANGNVDDAVGALDQIAFHDQAVTSEQGNTDVVFFKVQSHAVNVVREFQKLAGHGRFETVNTRNSVTNGNNGTSLADFDALVVVFDLIFDDGTDFFDIDIHFPSTLGSEIFV